MRRARNLAHTGGATALEAARARKPLDDGLLSVAEAGTLARCSTNTINLAIRCGDLAATRTNWHGPLLDRELVLTWARRMRFVLE